MAKLFSGYRKNKRKIRIKTNEMQKYQNNYVKPLLGKTILVTDSNDGLNNKII